MLLRLLPVNIQDQLLLLIEAGGCIQHKMQLAPDYDGRKDQAG